MNMITDILLLTVFPASMAFAASMDLFTFTVPNRIAIALVVGFALLAPMIGLGWPDIGWHVLAASGALVVGFTLFALGWIGGGDAKLFAASALWLGPELLLNYCLVASLLGGGLTLMILHMRRIPLPASLVGEGWLVRLHDRKEGVPYGIALAVSGLIYYPYTPFMAALGAQ
jgi:prepilin peptidase CpaA